MVKQSLKPIAARTLFEQLQKVDYDTPYTCGEYTFTIGSHPHPLTCAPLCRIAAYDREFLFYRIVEIKSAFILINAGPQLYTYKSLIDYLIQHHITHVDQFQNITDIPNTIDDVTW